MSTYTSSLGLEQITPGDQAGLWGNTTNNNLALIDQAVTGVTPINFTGLSGTVYTLTDFDGAVDEARAAVLNVTGTATGSNTIVVPNKQKTYLVRNNTGQAITFRTASPSATYTVGAGFSILVFCDGNNGVFTGIQSPSTGTLTVPGGGTGATTFTAGFIKSPGGTNNLTSSATVSLSTEVSGTLPIANGGTGATTFTNNALVQFSSGAMTSLVGSSNGQVATWNGTTWIAQAPTTGVSSFSGGVTGLTPATATTGAITLSGTLEVTSGGTGSTTPAGARAALGVGSVGTINTNGSTTQFLRGDGTWNTPPTSGGTVTSVSGAGSVNGLTLTGTVTSAGSLTLGGTLSGSAPSLSVGSATTANSATTATTASSATTATTATNLSGGSVNATTGSFSSTVSATQFNVSGGGFLSNQSVTLGNGITGIFNTGSSNFGFQSGGTSVLFIAAGTGSVTNISGSYSAISDERIKENITPAPNYLDDLCQLNVVNYNLQGKTEKYLGLIAQEVQTVLPGLVEANAASAAYPDVPNLLSVKYSVLVPMLLQAVQELKAGLDAANAEIAALKAQ